MICSTVFDTKSTIENKNKIRIHKTTQNRQTDRQLGGRQTDKMQRE